MNMEEMHVDNWKDTIVKFLEGELSLLEEMKLKDWLKANPENEVLFGQYRDIWLASSVKSKSYSAKTQEAYHKIESAITGTTKKTSIHQQSRKFSYFMKVAAILILVFLTGLFSSQFLISKKLVGGKLCEVVTPLGSRTFIVLPDGSQVWLNAGSKLTYDNSFGEKDRKIKLIGEAFFKVMKNKQKPFIVTAGNIHVRALGTSFNVKAYPEDKTVSTTLVEGIVKIDGVKDKKAFSYTLMPSQNLIVVKVPTIISAENHNIKDNKVFNNIEAKEIKSVEIDKQVKTELYTSWKDERWTIEGESLGTLATLLERRFNIQIHIQTNDLNRYKFTGTIQNETLEQVLKYLRYTTPLKYTVEKGVVWWDIDPLLAKDYSKILDSNN